MGFRVFAPGLHPPGPHKRIRSRWLRVSLIGLVFAQVPQAAKLHVLRAAKPLLQLQLHPPLQPLPGLQRLRAALSPSLWANRPTSVCDQRSDRNQSPPKGGDGAPNCSVRRWLRGKSHKGPARQCVFAGSCIQCCLGASHQTPKAQTLNPRL